MAPGGFAPETPGAMSPASRSRFTILSMADEQLGEDSPIVVQVARSALADNVTVELDGSWTMVQSKKKISKELVQDFWNDIRFPTPTSQVWECSGGPSCGKVGSGTSNCTLRCAGI